jgi:predicted AAA+ superfamily ATPase
VLNTALMTVTAGLTPTEARADREFRGRLIESAVGAHLANAAAVGECELYYWRDRGHEVDFIVRFRNGLVAIEVKSGRAPQAHAGTASFAAAFKVRRTLLVGGDGISVEEFLAQPATHWLAE